MPLKNSFGTMTQFQPNCNNGSLSNQIAHEILRQVQKSFNLAHQSCRLTLVMTGTSAVISLVGVGLILAGKASEGTVTTTSGLASGTGFLQLSKEAQKQLEQANKRMDQLLEDLDDD